MSSIQREIRQSKPFASTAQEVVVALLRTSDVVRRRVADVLEPHDLGLQQYNILRILRGAGRDGLPTLEIADRLIERSPGITRLCDCLERRGLLTRERLTADRRVVQCRLTAAGKSLVDRLDKPVDEADATAVMNLTKKDQQALLALLDRVRGG